MAAPAGSDSGPRDQQILEKPVNPKPQNPKL